MNFKCIYTFIIGEYDTLKEPTNITPGWDYICVTDNPNLKSKNWRIIQILDEDKQVQPLKRRAMLVMIGYKKYLKNKYDIIVTIGGQMVINTNLDKFLDKYGYESSYDACLLKHPDRNCIYEEGKVIIQLKKDTKENIKTHVEIYNQKNYPKNNGLYATGVMIFNNKSKNLKKFLELWLQEYKTSPSIRDQMTLNYTIWKLKQDQNINLNIKELNFTKMLSIDRDIYIQPHLKKVKYS